MHDAGRGVGRVHREVGARVRAVCQLHGEAHGAEGEGAAVAPRGTVVVVAGRADARDARRLRQARPRRRPAVRGGCKTWQV